MPKKGLRSVDEIKATAKAKTSKDENKSFVVDKLDGDAPDVKNKIEPVVDTVSVAETHHDNITNDTNKTITTSNDINIASTTNNNDKQTSLDKPHIQDPPIAVPESSAPEEDLDDEATQDAPEGMDYQKEKDVMICDDRPFRIGEGVSVGKVEDPPKKKRKSVETTSSNPFRKFEIKNVLTHSGTAVKDEKALKAKAGSMTTNIAKVPTLTAGIGGGVRLLSGGIRPNMPLLVSMGTGNPAISLLPAGLPPGRYVILPGTSTTTKTTCTTVNTTSASMAHRVTTNIVPPTAVPATAAVPVAQITPSSTSSSSSPSAPTISVTTAGSLTPSIQVPSIQVPSLQVAPTRGTHTREKGRRKSYTTGEKLAMIEAVEEGQRKSTVADRFGVAPSTLACILSQRNKIRTEQDNLQRRRFRQAKLGAEEGRGNVGNPSRMVPITATPTLNALQTHALQTLSPGASDQQQPFTHFLASLTGPSSATAVLDTQPEEIIAVPDLMDRMGEDSSAGSNQPNYPEGKTMDEGDINDDEGVSGVKSQAMVDDNPVTTLTVDVGVNIDKSRDRNVNQSLTDDEFNDALDETVPQELPETPSSSSQGLTGPYLLKKEAHCATVLDQLLRDDTYADVTLTAEGQSLRAHRIVLCLSSPYFRQVLSREQHIQSVVLLRDVKFAELRNIIHFIYTGEVTVDAADLESFMRTAEMLEITSLSEGQKYISSRGVSQSKGITSGFSIGDFERILGAKRYTKDPSPPRKSRKYSGERPSSRCSSSDLTTNPIALIKEEIHFEEEDIDMPSTLQNVKTEVDKPPIAHQVNSSESTSESSKSVKERNRNKRKRRSSSDSIGGFAAIAGIQKNSEAEDEEALASAKTDNQFPNEDDKSILIETENSPLPGRCPHCPQLKEKMEDISMLQHLIAAHPNTPAYPCTHCWRTFAKRSNFRKHLDVCTLVDDY